jgi:hypothetical protein
MNILRTIYYESEINNSTCGCPAKKELLQLCLGCRHLRRGGRLGQPGTLKVSDSFVQPERGFALSQLFSLAFPAEHATLEPSSVGPAKYDDFIRHTSSLEAAFMVGYHNRHAELLSKYLQEIRSLQWRKKTAQITHSIFGDKKCVIVKL